MAVDRLAQDAGLLPGPYLCGMRDERDGGMGGRGNDFGAATLPAGGLRTGLRSGLWHTYNPA